MIITAGLVVAALVAACRAPVPTRGPQHPARADAPAGRLAGAPAILVGVPPVEAP
ncbi:MAG: hypothetical protein R3B06_25145 [Kofleriaceae bacterium]